MNIDTPYILIAFLVSCLCGFLLTPLILGFCKRKGLYDMPDFRKVHKIKVPRLGGVIFFPCTFIAFVIVCYMTQIYQQDNITLSLWTVYFFIGSSLIYWTGIIDDIMGLNAQVKLLVQVLSASAFPLSGLYVNNLYGLFGIYEIPFYIGAPLTVLFVSYVSNTINLIDGIDGLAASMSLVALSGFAYCYILWGLMQYVVLIVALMGAIVAFLYFNLFGKIERNRKIFMGDTGSLTIGFVLAFLGLKLSMINETHHPFQHNGLLISFTLLVIPVLDAIRVSVVRMCHRRSPMDPDKNHIHHKLLRAGCTCSQVLFVVVGLSLFYICYNFSLSHCFDMSISVIVILDVVCYIIFHQVVNRIIKHKQQKIVVFGDADA